MRGSPPPPTARPSTKTWTLPRALPRQPGHLDGARALLSMLIDASMSPAPPIPERTPTPSSIATAEATVPADSTTLAFELVRAEAYTPAKQSTDTWPLTTVPTLLEYDMSKYGHCRGGFITRQPFMIASRRFRGPIALRTSRTMPLCVSIVGFADCLHRHATELDCPVSTENSMTQTC
jgi:hypothetical protein